MKIGIIGISTATLDIAIKASHAGYEILMNDPRGNELFSDLVQNIKSSVKLSSAEHAAESAVVIVSLPWEHLQKTLEPLKNMNNKIILHANNYLFNSQNTESDDTSKKSGSQIIKELFPQAQIVKLFTMFNFNGPSVEKRLGNKTRILFSGGDTEVKKNVRSFLEKLDFSITEIVNYQNNLPI